MDLKKISILFLILVCCYGISAQNIDSLKNIQVNENHEYFEKYLNIASAYQRKDYDSLFQYSALAELYVDSLSQQYKLDNLKATAYFMTGTYDSANFLWKKNFNYSIKINDSLLIGRMTNNLGLNMIYQGIYDSAIFYLKESQRVKEKLNDPKLSSTINNIGIAYMKMDDNFNALKYYKLAANYKKKNDELESLANTYNNIGIVYKKLNRYDSAISYYNASLELAKAFNDEMREARIYNNLATIYEKQNKKDLALSYLERAIAIKRNLDIKNELLNSLNNYANLLLDAGELDKAFEVLVESDSIKNEIGSTLHSVNNLSIWSKYYEKTGNLSKALEYQRDYNDERIAQVNQEKSNKIAKWETKYETEKKEALIEKMALSEKLNKQTLQYRNKQIILLTVLMLIILIAGIALMLINSKKQKIEKEAQKKQIDALKNRVREIHNGTAVMELEMSVDELNEKIHDQLTNREFEVLQASLEGLTNSAIAKKLYISPNTVKYHLKNIYVKLGVDNRKEAYNLLVLNY